MSALRGRLVAPRPDVSPRSFAPTERVERARPLLSWTSASARRAPFGQPPILRLGERGNASFGRAWISPKISAASTNEPARNARAPRTQGVALAAASSTGSAWPPRPAAAEANAKETSHSAPAPVPFDRSRSNTSSRRAPASEDRPASSRSSLLIRDAPGRGPWDPGPPARVRERALGVGQGSRLISPREANRCAHPVRRRVHVMALERLGFCEELLRVRKRLVPASGHVFVDEELRPKPGHGAGRAGCATRRTLLVEVAAAPELAPVVEHRPRLMKPRSLSAEPLPRPRWSARCRRALHGRRASRGRHREC